MKHLSIFVATLCLGGLSTPSFAQSSDFDQAFASQGAEARVSLTIPLGNSADRPKTAPRLGFAVRNYEDSTGQSADWMLSGAAPYREMRLGLTLENAPKLMMNDKVLRLSDDEQTNIGTAGKVGLGVAAAAVVVVAAGVIFLASGDCGLGESGGDGCGT